MQTYTSTMCNFRLKKKQKGKFWLHFQSLWVNLGCFLVAKLQHTRIHHHTNSRIMAHINRSCTFSSCFIFVFLICRVERFESSFCLGVWAPFLTSLMRDVEAVGNPKDVAVFPHISINSPFLSHSLIGLLRQCLTVTQQNIICSDFRWSEPCSGLTPRPDLSIFWSTLLQTQ